MIAQVGYRLQGNRYSSAFLLFATLVFFIRCRVFISAVLMTFGSYSLVLTDSVGFAYRTPTDRLYFAYGSEAASDDSGVDREDV